MQTISILVTERCQASSIHMVIDLLIAANYAAKDYLKQSQTPFHFQLIGQHKKVHAYNRSAIENIQPISQLDAPDVVIIPGAFEAIIKEAEARTSLKQYHRLVTSLKEWHQQGTLLASACTGNFLLANTGLIQGRDITCHWASSSLASKLFPEESFHSDKLLIDHGDIISAGGAAAIAQMVLYIIARLHSRELALVTAKMMLIEMNFEQQSRFSIFRPNHNHEDALVLKLQHQLEQRFSEAFDLSAFAFQHSLSEKQVVRRFKQKTGETPLSYLQKIRIEQVKLSLEAGVKTINQTIWDVGYEDISSFRRLFKKATGLTLQEYRSRFSRSGL